MQKKYVINYYFQTRLGEADSEKFYERNSIASDTPD